MVEAKEIVINDYDPTVDLEVIFRIDRIRKIDFERGEEPLFVLEINIDGNKYEVGEWKGLDTYPRWRHIQNVDDSKENVTIEIKLFEKIGDEKIQCDISPRRGEYSEGKTLKLIYSLKNGSWWGDDFLGDANGYGHASGTEDGVYDENDCEIFFDIYQTDADADRLTWYEEVFIYGTDPNVSDYGKDYDGDGVPIEWEDKYGYDPFVYEEHSKLDVDRDGLQNVEEWQMQKWLADPFRQDIYVEIDFMEEHNGIKPIMPEESLQLQYSAFTKHNIMFLADNGIMG